MEIHKPEPFHTFREFLKEYGIIVLGVLTALGLEQAVEAYHKRHEVESAKQGIRPELRSTLAKATVETQMRECTQIQLAALADAIGKGDRAKLRALLAQTHFSHSFPWSDAAWRSVVSTDVNDNLSPVERRNYSQLYLLVDSGKTYQIDFMSAYFRLRALALSGLGQSQAAVQAQLTEFTTMSSALENVENISQVYREMAGSILQHVTTDAEIAGIPGGLDQRTQCQSAAARIAAEAPGIKQAVDLRLSQPPL